MSGRESYCGQGLDIAEAGVRLAAVDPNSPSTTTGRCNVTIPSHAAGGCGTVSNVPKLRLEILMYCTACGVGWPDETKFCGQCGAALPRTCPACGHSNPSDVKFCLECGKGLLTKRAATQ